MTCTESSLSPATRILAGSPGSGMNGSKSVIGTCTSSSPSPLIYIWNRVDFRSKVTNLKVFNKLWNRKLILRNSSGIGQVKQEWTKNKFLTNLNKTSIGRNDAGHEAFTTCACWRWVLNSDLHFFKISWSFWQRLIWGTLIRRSFAIGGLSLLHRSEQKYIIWNLWMIFAQGYN